MMADAAGNDRYGRDLHEVRYVHDELLALVDRLPERDFAGPSLLAGWTRAHVAAHLVHNAEGLTRLATWARTGVDVISSGALTHSVRALDLGLDVTVSGG